MCRSGRRSAMAADLLNRRGYRVANLTGGMTAWATAGLPVIIDSYKPGHII
jgi:rhodanese-related sulfurtransferase